MGCDIHDYAEIRREGRWYKVGKVFANPYHLPEEPSRVDEDGFEWNAEKTEHPFKGRNYDVFAILADVRNGRGFAGCVTGGRFSPISKPKGLPPDISDDVLKKYVLMMTDDESQLDDCVRSGRWEGARFCTRIKAESWINHGLSTLWPGETDVVTSPDWHSASWLTLRELQEFDWAQKNKHQGLVNPKGFREWEERGKPRNWSGGVFGRNVIKVSVEEMRSLLRTGAAKADSSLGGEGPYYYTQVEWTETYAESAKDFLTRTMPALAALGAPDDVRMVFWFDN